MTKLCNQKSGLNPLSLQAAKYRCKEPSNLTHTHTLESFALKNSSH